MLRMYAQQKADVSGKSVKTKWKGAGDGPWAKKLCLAWDYSDGVIVSITDETLLQIFTNNDF